MKEFAWPTAPLREATNTGLAQAANSLAAALRVRGLAAVAPPPAEGRARVVIEGAGLMAREFGTLSRAAAPVIAPVVRGYRREIVRLIAAELAASSSEAVGRKRIVR